MMTFSSLATLADFEEWEAERDQTLSHSTNLALIDVRACNIQTQEIAEKIRKTIGEDASRFRRVAIVTGASAIKMQMRRMSGEADTVRGLTTGHRLRLGYSKLYLCDRIENRDSRLGGAGHAINRRQQLSARTSPFGLSRGVSVR
ncbi:STAS/SEC14 domain-containing protein [Sphingomonas xinjiangensis]|uniref:Uncharacterized protein n=1 Tax=Sphingomonas xinjiangensis TaxID=643568 RepID=A0A840YKV1_9SPHN|nr:STAS/SEC14 domain-containing protein [Sphingomonas xinjiangensis]MBB5709740.1 hypothetical protein [Sphingomonas xinjiangensis]